jgi:hypothetical protein
VGARLAPLDRKAAGVAVVGRRRGTVEVRCSTEQNLIMWHAGYEEDRAARGGGLPVD